MDEGFDIEEQFVMDKLVDAYNMFITLDKQHPAEQSEFAQNIHILQGLLALRALRRQFDCFPIYAQKPSPPKGRLKKENE